VDPTRHGYGHVAVACTLVTCLFAAATSWLGDRLGP
jgi:hypothetical protein